MSPSGIVPGMILIATTADCSEVRMVARSAVVRGRDMPVVWVSEYGDYARDGAAAHRIPWPAESVRPAVRGEREAP